jgi:hypothetical protein
MHVHKQHPYHEGPLLQPDVEGEGNENCGAAMNDEGYAALDMTRGLDRHRIRQETGEIGHKIQIAGV